MVAIGWSQEVMSYKHMGHGSRVKWVVGQSEWPSSLSDPWACLFVGEVVVQEWKKTVLTCVDFDGPHQNHL